MLMRGTEKSWINCCQRTGKSLGISLKGRTLKQSQCKSFKAGLQSKNLAKIVYIWRKYLLIKMFSFLSNLEICIQILPSFS